MIADERHLSESNRNAFKIQKTRRKYESFLNKFLESQAFSKIPKLTLFHKLSVWSRLRFQNWNSSSFELFLWRGFWHFYAFLSSIYAVCYCQRGSLSWLLLFRQLRRTQFLWARWICNRYNGNSTITVISSTSYCDDLHPIGHSMINIESTWPQHRLRIIILCHSRIIWDDTKSLKLVLLVQFSRFEKSR